DRDDPRGRGRDRCARADGESPGEGPPPESLPACGDTRAPVEQAKRALEDRRPGPLREIAEPGTFTAGCASATSGAARRLGHKAAAHWQTVIACAVLATTMLGTAESARTAGGRTGESQGSSTSPTTKSESTPRCGRLNS